MSNNYIDPNPISKSLDILARDKKINNPTYDNLKSKRKKIEKKIIEFSNMKNKTIVDKFNVGSYKTKTGVNNHDGTFDIDYAIVFEDSNFENYGNFKENMTIWLRNQLKNDYKLGIRVASKKSVIAIRFYDKEFENNDKKTIFHLDIAFYIKKDDDIYHLKRDDNKNYSLIKSEPKKTYTRQKDALNESEGKNSKRNAIILLKLLKSGDHLNGISSIYITDKICSYNISLDTFSLMKQFIVDAKVNSSFKLLEEPNSELIMDFNKLNLSAKKLLQSFEGNSTVEIYEKLNSKFNKELKALDKENLESETERHFGG